LNIPAEGTIDVLLIYPHLGSWDNVIRDMPLSIIYVATLTVKAGFNVKILDLRINAKNWKECVDEYISKKPKLVGISVMTGKPILNALDISRFIKAKMSAPIVWGGPHPTILPEQTLENEYIDYIIRDWGSKSLLQLTQYLSGQDVQLNQIDGLGYKKNGQLYLNSSACEFEKLALSDIPYHLVDINKDYFRIIDEELVFPIFTSLGCPYQCSFCVSPNIYKKIKGKKWISYDVDEVLDHIEVMRHRYAFKRIQVYDDDGFVDLEKKLQFFRKYIDRGYHQLFKLDFRAMRVNELDMIDDDYLSLMAKANVQVLMIGAESGANTTLERMNKMIRVEDTIRVNQKLARYPSLRPMYNLFCGSPGETLEEIYQTKNLMIKLVEDNPYCYLGFCGDWKPIPGSVVTENAVINYKLELPSTLEKWGNVDSFDAKKIVHPWYTKEIDDTIKMLQVAVQVLDRKVIDFRHRLGPGLGMLIYLISICYKPLIRFRLKYNVTAFLFEYHIENYLIKHLGDLKSIINKIVKKISIYNVQNK
jgi:anaerobic magnesium-protoporphyrin IX monomethyl ester cyclase